MPAPFRGERPSFLRALAEGRRRGTGAELPAVIAEYKRASPSRGEICSSVTVEDAVLAYAANGASALSILTEERYFRGCVDFLVRARAALDARGFRQVPLLRKDFLFDPLQVEATLATPASAFLLIVRQNPDARELRVLRELGERHGLEAVVEIFDGDELEIARSSGARIIQVNARNLETFAVDREACLTLGERHIPASQGGDAPGEVWIAASGMDARAHLVDAARAGYTAALVGTALMEKGTPGPSLAALLGREAADPIEPIGRIDPSGAPDSSLPEEDRCQDGNKDGNQAGNPDRNPG